MEEKNVAEDSELEEGPKDKEQSAPGEKIATEAVKTSDTRNVVVTTKFSREYIPIYVPTPVSKLQEILSQNEAGHSKVAEKETEGR